MGAIIIDLRHAERREVTSLQASSQQKPLAELPLQLRFEEGRAFLCASDFNWGSFHFRRLEMNISGISFPFDMSGGVRTLRQHWCRLHRLAVGLESSQVPLLFNAAAVAQAGFSHLSVVVDHGVVLLHAQCHMGDHNAAVVMRAAPVVVSAHRVQWVFFDIRVLGWLPIPAPLLPVLLKRCLDCPWLVDDTMAGAWAFEPVRDILRELFPRAGWKIPDSSGVQLVHVAATRDRIVLVAQGIGQDIDLSGLPSAPPEAIAFADGIARHHDAEVALSEGRIEDAYVCYWNTWDAGLRDFYVASRLLQLGVHIEAWHERTERLAQSLISDQTLGVPAHLALANLGGMHGDCDLSGKHYRQLAEYFIAERQHVDAMAAYLAVGVSSEAQAPRMALEAYEHAASLKRSDVAAQEGVLRLRCALGDWDGAIRAGTILTGLVQDPLRCASIHGRLGHVWFAQLGDPGKARLHIERAIALDPHEPDYVELLAEIYAALGEPGRAASFLSELARRIEQEGDVSRAGDIHVRLAGIWLRCFNNTTQARARLECVDPQANAYGRSLLALSQLAVRDNDLERARRSFEETIAHTELGSGQPDVDICAQAYAGLCTILPASSYKERLVVLSRALELKPDAHAIRRVFLLELFTAGRHTEAARQADLLAEAIKDVIPAKAEIQSECADAWYEAARLHVFIGSENLAIRERLVRCLEHDPTHGHALGLWMATGVNSDEIERQFSQTIEHTHDPVMRVALYKQCASHPKISESTQRLCWREARTLAPDDLDVAWSWFETECLAGHSVALVDLPPLDPQRLIHAYDRVRGVVRRLMARGHHEHMRPLAKSLVDVAPEDPEALWLLALTYAENHREHRRLRKRMLMRLDQEHRIGTKAMDAADMCIQAGDKRRARHFLARAMSSQVFELHALQRAQRMALELNDRSLLRRVLTPVLEFLPYDVALRWHVGLLALADRQREDACKILRPLHDHGVHGPSVCHLFFESSLERGDYAEAQRWAMHIVALPLSQSWVRKQQTHEAMGLLFDLGMQGPAYERYSYANRLKERGDISAYVTIKQLGLRPDDAQGRYALASLLLDGQLDLARARQLAEEALALFPTEPSYRTLCLRTTTEPLARAQLLLSQAMLAENPEEITHLMKQALACSPLDDLPKLHDLFRALLASLEMDATETMAAMFADAGLMAEAAWLSEKSLLQSNFHVASLERVVAFAMKNEGDLTRPLSLALTHADLLSRSKYDPTLWDAFLRDPRLAQNDASIAAQAFGVADQCGWPDLCELWCEHTEALKTDEPSIVDASSIDVERYPEALHRLQNDFAEGRFEAASLRMAARLAGQLENHILASGYYRVLLALLPHDQEARQFVDAVPSWSLVHSDDDLLIYRDQSPLDALVRTIRPLMLGAIAQRYGEIKLRDGDVISPASVYARQFTELLARYHVRGIRMYRWREGGLMCRPHLLASDALMLGSRILDASSEQEQTFVVARTAHLMRSGHELCLHMKDVDMLASEVSALLDVLRTEQVASTPLARDALTGLPEGPRHRLHTLAMEIEDSSAQACAAWARSRVQEANWAAVSPYGEFDVACAIMAQWHGCDDLLQDDDIRTMLQRALSLIAI